MEKIKSIRELPVRNLFIIYINKIARQRAILEIIQNGA